MSKLPRVRVCLFLTYGISLKKWDELGLLDREVILYKELVKSGVEVAFFTYGGEEDFSYQHKLEGIRIIPAYAYVKKPKNKKMAFFQSLFFPFKFKSTFIQYDIFKTNQMFGGWVPLIAKWVTGKRLLVRCGYEHYFTLTTERRSFIEKLLFYLFSKIAYFFSNQIVVTSEWIAYYVSKKFLVFRNKISVLPNLVDVELFAKSDLSYSKDRVLFVGRLNREKNLLALIEACKKADCSLDLVGQGDMKKELSEFADKVKAKVRFLGVFPNNELPSLIIQYPIFILPSFYEGNPKVLLEAMSCARAVIGANVDGIRNIIRDGENGILCGTSADQITEAILRIKNDIPLQKRLGENARQYIMDNHSVQRILSKEISVYSRIIKRNIEDGPPRLGVCLFFTYGISLRDWDELGLFDREVILYKDLVSKGVNVTFFTYGGKEDLVYSKRLRGIKIIPAYANIKKPRNKKLAFLQSFLYPLIFWREFAKHDIFKTNQMFGGWVPLMAKWLTRKRLLVRCGYEHYYFIIAAERSFFEKFFFYLFSKMVYFFSNHIIVTSDWIANYVSRKFFVFRKKISILPNLVDTTLFNGQNKSFYSEINRILFIGRLNKQKNLMALVEASKKSNIGLDLVGQGDLKIELEKKAKEINADIRFIGLLPNREIPSLITKYPIFILPSFYEGNPKVLLEAMGCGRAVIGAKVDGIRDIIKDGENGILCGTSADQIAAAILKLKDNINLQKELGGRARRYVLDYHSADKIIHKELEVYSNILK